MSSFETGVRLAPFLFWVPFPFGFQLVLYQFCFGTSCLSGRGVLIGPTHGSSPPASRLRYPATSSDWQPLKNRKVMFRSSLLRKMSRSWLPRLTCLVGRQVA